MFQKLSFALCAVAAVFISLPAQASDIVFPGGGTLAQIIDGGGTNTIFTLVNLDGITAQYTLSFFDDNGNPLTLSTTAAGAPSASLSGSLNAYSSVIIQTNGSTPVAGYAVLATGQLNVDPNTGVVTSRGNQIAGSAVFGLPLPGIGFTQASCPLDTGLDTIIELPFDQTGDAVTGVALVNSFADQIYQTNGGGTAILAVTFFDQSGNALALPPLTLKLGQHTAFLLRDQYPQTKNQKGVVRFVGADSSGRPYVFKALGVRATATTYTSITPIIPCNISSTSGGCTN